MGQRIAHEMTPATLPGRVHDLGDNRLDADKCVGCDKFHGDQASKVVCAGSRSRMSRLAKRLRTAIWIDNT